jgi:hypothetical protein
VQQPEVTDCNSTAPIACPSIQEYTDHENNPMIPHTLVLKPSLVIYSIYNGYWFWGVHRSSIFGTTCAP